MSSDIRYGIVCAMREEVEKIIEAFNLKRTHTNFGFAIYTNDNTNDNIILIESKIGKVASTLATSTLISGYHPDIIINIGIAGSINSMYAGGSAYIISSVIQHDTYMPFEEYQDDMYQRINCFMPIPNEPISISTATLATGDQFIENANNVNADLVDMEGFAVCYTAKAHDIKSILIKGVSDSADDVAQDVMFANLNKAMDSTINILKNII
jgi:nucleoside phosphorylase